MSTYRNLAVALNLAIETTMVRFVKNARMQGKKGISFNIKSKAIEKALLFVRGYFDAVTGTISSLSSLCLPNKVRSMPIALGGANSPLS